VPHRVEEADVASASEVDAMVDRVVAAWGRLDILVNNAGIQTETPGGTFDDEKFERILAVNLIGAARCARAAIRHFLSRPGGGVIINTSSVHEVVPGTTITDMNSAWTEDSQKRAMVEGHIPMGRAATPDEIAPIFAFFASDEASYITGQTLYACGGITLHADFAQNWSS
jgi:glucose 1-dehydrogenase